MKSIAVNEADSNVRSDAVRQPLHIEQGVFAAAPGKGNRVKMSSYVYILKCSDNTLYTGWTTCLERRLREHNSGKGAKYTRSRCPVELVYYEELGTKEEALRREYAIKQMKRREKELLIGKREAVAK